MINEEIKKNVRTIFQQYMCHEKIDLEVTKELYEYLRYQKLDMVFGVLNQDNGQYAEVFEQREKQVIEINRIYKKEISNFINLLEEIGIPYVILKGWSCLISLYHNFSDRYFFDVDILVRENDLDTVEKLLFSQGYIYGEVKNNIIVEPDRKAILFQRHFTHELYNMVKKINDNFVNIDINFKFSWRGIHNSKINNISYEDVEEYIESTLYDKEKISIFNENMQFVHLCCHFYNEASFFCLDMEFEGGDPKELRLFRLMDIFLLLNKVNIVEVKKISEQFNCTESIDFAVEIICIIMGNSFVKNIFPWEIRCDHLNHYMGRDKKWHEWPISLEERLFNLEIRERVCTHLFSKNNIMKGENDIYSKSYK